MSIHIVQEEIALPELNVDKSPVDLSALRFEKGYDAYLREQRKVWPAVPNVQIKYNKVSYEVDVPFEEKTFETVWSTYLSLFRKRHTKKFSLIKEVTGTIKPGTMTLVLAPPGHGKSQLLKTLAKGIHTSGSLTYNGLTAEQVAERGINLTRINQYVEQVDVHLPLLTVRETLEFAAASSIASDVENLDAHVKEVIQNKVTTVIKLLGLQECADTIVGNQLIRGISGGQLKRLTVGEMLVGEARNFFLDEITNGLDSATAYDILKALRTWTTMFKGSVVAALLQPTPEVLALFDDLILLRESYVVYHGPVNRAMGYFESINFLCPKDQDEADFMQELLSFPGVVYQRQLSLCMDDADPEKKRAVPPLTTDGLVKAWTSSDMYQRLLQQVETPGASGIQLDSDFAQAQYGREYPRSFMSHFSSNLKRQAVIYKRNSQLIGPRVGQAVIMSLIMGSLYYNKGTSESEIYVRIGLILFVAIQLAFTNLIEQKIVVEDKKVVYKQSDAKFYPVLTYVLSIVIVHFPLSIVECGIFGTVIWWMTNFVADAGRYFIWLVLVWLSNLASSVIFRFYAWVSPGPEIAETLAAPSTAVFLLFGGFLITESNIPGYAIWLYWLSPFSWVLRAAANLEFGSSRYDDPYTINGIAQNIRRGDAYMDIIDIRKGDKWIWACVLYLIGLFAFMTALGTLVLSYKRYALARGTRRFEETDDDHQITSTNHGPPSPKRIDVKATPASHHAHSLPFTPVSLTFSDLRFTVFPSKNQSKVLLRGVSGFAKPNTLTALMGASGAGKTTLLDVIAGRKTQGRIEGNILVNGQPQNMETFRRVAGYVEQMDMHIPFASVRESLMLSARLRLSGDASPETREGFVEEILNILELTQMGDHLIGEPDKAGLSPGQLKRVTIGVELVANPALLFLDEPTTGLDSRAALVVMRVIRRIATTGRTLICTIHQPSAELFYMFDRLLLLKSGGEVVFFGSLGYRGQGLVQFLEAIPGVPQRPARMNPATWMLDVIGAGSGSLTSDSAAESHVVELKQDAQEAKLEAVSAPKVEDFAVAYKKSELCAENASELQAINSAGGAGLQEKGYARAWIVQFWALLMRGFRSHNRNIEYNFVRLNVLIGLSVMFGLLFLQLKATSISSLNSIIGFIFTFPGFNAVFHSAAALPVLAKQRAVFYRERASNTYSSTAYSLTIFLVEIPWVALCTICFVTIGYFMVGLKRDAGIFFSFYLAVLLLGLAFANMGQLLTSALPNIIVAGILQGVYFGLFFMFGGLFITQNEIPIWWQWMHRADPLYHTFEATLMPQFDCSTPGCNGADLPLFAGATIPIKDFVSMRVGLAYGSYGSAIGYLFLHIVVVRILTMLALRFISHLKR